MEALMRIYLLITAIAAFLIGSHAAHAQTADDMYSYCAEVENAEHRSDGSIVFQGERWPYVCWGAFATIRGLSFTSVGMTNISALHVCAPPESTLAQFVRIFRRFVEGHPERGHEDFYRIALEALWQAFSCATR